MKRILLFSELPPEMKQEAVTRIGSMAEGRTRYCGEVWTESSQTLAEEARYEMTIKGGEYTGIWGVLFASPPKIQPGTEFQPKNKYTTT